MSFKDFILELLIKKGKTVCDMVRFKEIIWGDFYIKKNGKLDFKTKIGTNTNYVKRIC